MCDRTRVKQELGNWIKTTYNSINHTMICDCERYNLQYGDCDNCVFVEVLHSERHADGNANEQWQEGKLRMIHNLTQCNSIAK